MAEVFNKKKLAETLEQITTRFLLCPKCIKTNSTSEMKIPEAHHLANISSRILLPLLRVSLRTQSQRPFRNLAELCRRDKEVANKFRSKENQRVVLDMEVSLLLSIIIIRSWAIITLLTCDKFMMTPTNSLWAWQRVNAKEIIPKWATIRKAIKLLDWIKPINPWLSINSRETAILQIWLLHLGSKMFRASLEQPAENSLTNRSKIRHTQRKITISFRLRMMKDLWKWSLLKWTMIKLITEVICQTSLMHQLERKDWAATFRKTIRRGMPWLTKESKKTSFLSNWCSCRVNNSIKTPAFRRDNSRRKAWELLDKVLITALSTPEIQVLHLVWANWISRTTTNNSRARPIDETSWWATKIRDSNLMKPWRVWISIKAIMGRMLNLCPDRSEEIHIKNSPPTCPLWSRLSKSSCLTPTIWKTIGKGFLIWAVFLRSTRWAILESRSHR